MPITSDRVRENVSHNLRILLEAKDLSQTDLAEKSRVHKMQISRYINKRTRCNVDDVANIAEALNIDLGIFVTERLSLKSALLLERQQTAGIPQKVRSRATSYR